MLLRDVYDLIILQATPAGIAAAVSAAKKGYTSLILERTGHIGGLPANGLGTTDIATRACGGGFFKDFVLRIKQLYIEEYGASSSQVRACDGGFRFEPHVAERVFHDFIQEEHPRIIVLRNRQFDFEPENLSIKQDRITSIRVTNRENQQQEVYNGRFFIDASYEGDLIAAANVPFFVGREGKDVYDEPGAGRVYKIWSGSEQVSGSTHIGDNAIQAFNYRLCLTNDPSKRAPFRPPVDYSRNEYASMIDDIRSGVHTAAWNRLSPQQQYENRKRAAVGLPPVPNVLPGIKRIVMNNWLPNSKVDANNQHQAFLSTDLPEENWPYPTSSWAWRDRFASRLRSYTQGLLYFAQNDPELPKWFQDQMQGWGYAADEYTDNDNFPRQVYVREGRRMKGKYVFTAHDTLPSRSTGKAPLHRDSIAAHHYPLDSHAVRKREPGRVHLDGFVSYKSMPCTVPYGVIVPDAPVRNLLAPVPVSGSHIGFSTLRMEPCWMALGQAAGIAAYICILDGCCTNDLDVGLLQEALLEEGAVLWYGGDAAEGVSREEVVEMQRRRLMCGDKHEQEMRESAIEK